MKKKHRKSIRLDGRLVTKEFTTAESAKAWYSQMHSKKVLGDFGLHAPKAKRGPLFKDFASGEFMERRRANYPESTWSADEQRLRDHVLPALGDLPIAKIKVGHVRALLNMLTEKKGLSSKTRDRVQALISVVFTEAINRPSGPLVDTNPCFGITFRRGKRTGVKPPSYLHRHDDCVRLLRAAKALGPMHCVATCLGMMAGLRKQEMIALRFKHLDFDSGTLEVSEKYVQASQEIVRGTKAGEHAIRYVPMGEKLSAPLYAHMQSAKFSDDDDFVLHNPDRSHMSPRQIYDLIAAVARDAGLKVTVHGLRHTFGREFAERSGNMAALQDILGHSNSATTRLYSTLGKDRLGKFKDVMDFDF